MLFKKYLLALVTVLYCSLTGAQGHQLVEKKIRQLENDVVQAILRSDTTALNNLWTPDFLVNTPRNNIANGKAAVFTIQQAGLINYSTFERTIEQIRIHGRVVVTMGSEQYTTAGSAAAPVRRRFTNVWMKQGREWRQVARHASVICE